MSIETGLRRRRRQLSRWILLAVTVGFLATIARLNFVMHDMYHEMAVARAWVETGTFPTEDLFAFTPTVSPSVHHEWAMGLLLYGWSKSFGLEIYGITILRFLLIAGLLAAIYSTARKRGATPLMIGCAAPLVFLFAWMGFGTLRATLVTLFFLAVQLRLLEEDRCGRRGWVLFLLPLWILWLNIHAGYLVGAGLFGLYFGERLITDAAGFIKRRRYGGSPSAFVRRLARRHWHLLGLCFVTVPALGLTPYGSAYPRFVLHAAQMSRPHIAEWGPLWTTWWPGWTILCYVAAIGLVLIAATRIGIRKSAGLLLILAAAYFGLRHLRHGPLLAVVWCCYAPSLFQAAGWGRVLRALAHRRQAAVRRVAIGVSAVSLLYIVAYHGYRTELIVQGGAYNQRHPAGVTDYLARTGWRGNVLTPFHAGAYMLWHAYPQVQISLDGRYEVAYQPGVFEAHRGFYADNRDDYDLPDRWEADAVLVNSDQPIATRLSADEAWRRVYIDDAYTLFVRTLQADHLPIEDRRGDPLSGKFL